MGVCIAVGLVLGEVKQVLELGNSGQLENAGVATHISVSVPSLRHSLHSEPSCEHIQGARLALGVRAAVLRAGPKRGLRVRKEGLRCQYYGGNSNDAGETPRRGSVGVFPPLLL